MTETYEWRAATPAESEAWHAGWQLPDGMSLRETDHGLEVRQNTALTEEGCNCEDVCGEPDCWCHDHECPAYRLEED